jgi:hypothetical protein
VLPDLCPIITVETTTDDRRPTIDDRRQTTDDRPFSPKQLLPSLSHVSLSSSAY